MATLQPFACKNQTLLVRQDTLVVLHFGFDTLHGVPGLGLEDSHPHQGLHDDLRLCVCCEAAPTKACAHPVEEKEGGRT